MRIVHDDRGRELAYEAPPQRIVSLVPSISETLWHLGAGSRLVGVTRYCTDPAEVAALPRCGGTKNPDIAAIIALRPDLVLMSEEENRIEDFQQLVDRGLRVFVSFPRGVGDVPSWVRRVGAVAGCEAAAERMAAEIQTSVRDLDASVAGRRRRRVLCPIWKRPWMTFNADTYAHSVLEACGGDNVFAAAEERYCSFALDAALAHDPDLILLPDEPYPFSARDLADIDFLVQPRGPAEAARIVDGQALSWYGWRTPSGLRVIREAIVGGNA